MKRLLVDVAVLMATVCVLALANGQADAGVPCEEWYEVVGGKDVQTGEDVRCDGVQGPRQQFSELMKCVEADLPGCEVRLKAEKERAEKVETALRKKVAIEEKRGDGHADEEARLRRTLEDLATVEWDEHPAFWGGVGLVVGVVLTVLIVEAVR